VNIVGVEEAATIGVGGSLELGEIFVGKPVCRAKTGGSLPVHNSAEAIVYGAEDLD